MPDIGSTSKNDGSETRDTLQRGELTLKSITTASEAATRLSLVAASNQLQSLALHAPHLPGGEAGETPRTRRLKLREDLKHAFINEGFAELSANHNISIAAVVWASSAIRAKAAALGYTNVDAVEITSVPGGFVGRFGGNDIYAAG